MCFIVHSYFWRQLNLFINLSVFGVRNIFQLRFEFRRLRRSGEYMKCLFIDFIQLKQIFSSNNDRPRVKSVRRNCSMNAVWCHLNWKWAVNGIKWNFYNLLFGASTKKESNERYMCIFIDIECSCVYRRQAMDAAKSIARVSETPSSVETVVLFHKESVTVWTVCIGTNLMNAKS